MPGAQLSLRIADALEGIGSLESSLLHLCFFFSGCGVLTKMIVRKTLEKLPVISASVELNDVGFPSIQEKEPESDSPPSAKEV